MSLENLTKTEYIKIENNSRMIKRAIVEIFKSSGNRQVAYALFQTDLLANQELTFEQFERAFVGMVF